MVKIAAEMVTFGSGREGASGDPALSTAAGEELSAITSTDSASSAGAIEPGSALGGKFGVGSNGDASLGWDSKSSPKGATSVSGNPLMAFSGWVGDVDRLGGEGCSEEYFSSSELSGSGVMTLAGLGSAEGLEASVDSTADEGMERTGAVATLKAISGPEGGSSVFWGGEGAWTRLLESLLSKGASGCRSPGDADFCEANSSFGLSSKAMNWTRKHVRQVRLY